MPGSLRYAIKFVYDTDAPTDNEEFKPWCEMVYADQLNAGLAGTSILPKPDSDSFFCTQSELMLFDEDGRADDYATAKTRLGESSTRLALLDKALFKQACGHYPDAVLAKKVLLRSVSISSRVVAQQAGAGFAAPIEGDGLLKGVILLEMINESYLFCAQKGTVLLREDPDLGIVIERGKDIGGL